MASDLVTITGALPNDLANAVSEAIHTAIGRGMDVDEASCVAIGVAADYAREAYGDGCLEGLCSVVQSRVGKPLPDKATDASPPRRRAF